MPESRWLSASAASTRAFARTSSYNSVHTRAPFSPPFCPQLQANGSPALQPRVRTAHDLAPSSLSSLIKVASEPSLKARIPRTPKRTPDPYRSAKWRDHPSPGDPSSRQTTPRRGGQRRGTHVRIDQLSFLRHCILFTRVEAI